jgi:hypothetical protein
MPKFPMRQFAAALPMWLLACLPVSAETRVTIAGGRITVIAKDATAQQILAEWARVGGMTVVNLESLPGGPLTIELTSVSEREALEVLMRSARGYIVTARDTPDDTHSSFERILVMPSGSTTVVAAAPAPSRPAPFLDDIDTLPPPGVVLNTQQQSAGAPIAGGSVFGGVPLNPQPMTQPVTGANAGAVTVIQQEVGDSSTSGKGSALSRPSRAAAPTPGSTGNGNAAAAGVTAPGIVAPAPLELLMPAVSPSEYQSDPTKGSATPGTPVPSPSRLVAAPTPPPPSE